MATCFDAVCMVWQAPDSAPGEHSPPPSHVSVIGFRVRNFVQTPCWLPGEQQPPAVVLYDEHPVDASTGSPAVHGEESSACISQLLSLVGVPPFYNLASVVQVIHSKAVAMAFQATKGASGGVVPPVVTEIPFLWYFPPQEEVQQSLRVDKPDEGEDQHQDQDEDQDQDQDEDEDGDCDNKNDTTDEVVSIILEEGTDTEIDLDLDIDIDMDMDMDMNPDVDVTVPATKASIEALERSNLDGLNSDDKCIICLEQYLPAGVGNEVGKMPCSHVFHKDCIVEWLKKSHACPLCRFKMPVDPS